MFPDVSALDHCEKNQLLFMGQKARLDKAKTESAKEVLVQLSWYS